MQILSLMGMGKEGDSSFIVGYDLTNGSCPSNIAFSRASEATHFNNTPELSTVSTDEPRFDYDPLTGAVRGLLVEPSTTNLIKTNNTTGVVMPSTYPSGWLNLFGTGGATTQIESIGIEDGIPYIDISVVGTSGASSDQAGSFLVFSGSKDCPVTLGDDVCLSAYIKLVDGDFSNVDLGFCVRERSSTGGGVQITPCQKTSLKNEIPTDNLRKGRIEDWTTMGGTATVYAVPEIYLSCNSGAVLNFTIRIGLPQLEHGVAATSVLETSGYSVTRAEEVVQFTIPNGVTKLRYTFDDDSTQDVTVAAGSYTIPTNLNRSWTKTIQSVGV